MHKNVRNVYKCGYLLPYLILSIRNSELSINERAFVAMIGISLLSTPYTIHNPIPDKTMMSILRETSFACFSLRILISCGIDAKEVKRPAEIPIICSVSADICAK